MLRCAKSLFAFVLVLGVGLAPTVTPAGAAANKVLDWQVIGEGTGQCTATTTPGSPPVTTVTCNVQGNASGTHIGNGTYDVSSTLGTILGPNGAGGVCALSAGTGMVTAADGSIVTLNVTGLQCQEGSSNTPPAGSFNGTYRITGGTGRFSDAAGGGSITATFANSAPGGVFGPGGVSFIKIDGAINF
jgi:hypothetical protein